jgi:WhiB family transcriptional regulator, redox-sensing transcriptional regulator
VTERKAEGGRRVTHNRNKFWVAMPDWMSNAACGNTPIGLWFHESDNHELTAEAKEICYDCPVRQECLTYAFETGSVDGIFGGYTSRERKALLRNAQRRRNGKAVAQ